MCLQHLILMCLKFYFHLHIICLLFLHIQMSVTILGLSDQNICELPRTCNCFSVIFHLIIMVLEWFRWLIPQMVMTLLDLFLDRYGWRSFYGGREQELQWETDWSHHYISVLTKLTFNHDITCIKRKYNYF